MTDGPTPRPRRPVRPKADLRDLAQRYTRLAVETLAEVARTSDKEAARVAAANALLERGWGRTGQATAVAGPVRIEVITGIDRDGGLSAGDPDTAADALDAPDAGSASAEID